jgi:hypothetical protein
MKIYVSTKNGIDREYSDVKYSHHDELCLVITHNDGNRTNIMFDQIILYKEMFDEEPPRENAK